MDPVSSEAMASTPAKSNGKDILDSEQPTLLCRTAAKKVPRTPLFSLKGPITPAPNRKCSASAYPLVNSPEPDLADSQSDGSGGGGYCSESATDVCSTPKERVFDTFGSVTDDDDDGCATPRASVFDAFAPCKTCPPTPGPVIPQRIRLW